MSSPLQRAIDQVSTIVLGKRAQVRLAVACLVARGHLLVEDLPGVGKTTLAQAIARSLGLAFQRIQFTNDLLPADILGVSVFDAATRGFTFHPGPVFAQLVLADELNRATPRTQSALLEAMEERQVTLDAVTRELPDPFFVIATQNPSHQLGTFDLPESQLDRFLVRIRLGYPDAAAERALLAGEDRRSLLAALQPCVTPEALRGLQQRARTVHASPALLDYVQALVVASRAAADVAHGLSPRGGLALLACARAWALIDERQHVEPEDVQAVFHGVAGHRLAAAAGTADAAAADARISRLLADVPVP
jgi:MoxR-like ATPase